MMFVCYLYRGEYLVYYDYQRPPKIMPRLWMQQKFHFDDVG